MVCIPAPYIPGAACKTRLESRIKRLKSPFVYDLFLQALVSAAIATKKPVVVVVLSGGSVSIDAVKGASNVAVVYVPSHGGASALDLSGVFAVLLYALPQDDACGPSINLAMPVASQRRARGLFTTLICQPRSHPPRVPAKFESLAAC